jgi:hypothetical protein
LVKTIILLPEQPPPFKGNIFYEKPFYKNRQQIYGYPYIGLCNEETASGDEARRVGAELTVKGTPTGCGGQPVVIPLHKEVPS